MKKVVMLCGVKGSGKDTFAHFLVERGYKRIAFADPLKEIAACALDIDVSVFHDPLIKEKRIAEYGTELTYRKMLELLGTEFFRKHFPNFWAQRAVRCIENSPGKKFVITDLRFPDEASLIKSHFSFYQIARIIHPAKKVPTDWETGAYHPSEYSFMSIPTDYVINNDGTLEELREKSKEFS